MSEPTAATLRRAHLKGHTVSRTQYEQCSDEEKEIWRFLEDQPDKEYHKGGMVARLAPRRPYVNYRRALIEEAGEDYVRDLLDQERARLAEEGGLRLVIEGLPKA